VSKFIYIAHPFQGETSNALAVEEIIKKNFSNHVNEFIPISPIHAFGYLYDSIDYIAGMDLCLSLLDKCDIIIMCGDWKNSKGCLLEYFHAKASGKIILKQEELDGM